MNQLHGLRVLVVDDNALNLLVTRLQLERLGAEVEVQEEGLDALRLLFERGPQAFHVVLMDLNIPSIDGIEAIRRIRLRPGFERQVVMGLSGEIDPKAIDRAMAAGCADFIPKPFDLRVLASKLAPRGPGASAPPAA